MKIIKYIIFIESSIMDSLNRVMLFNKYIQCKEKNKLYLFVNFSI